MATRNPEGRDVVIEAPATFVDRVRPDGVIVRWESRHHRKHQKPAVGSTWWAPKARGWWIAILFAIGSLLFALVADGHDWLSLPLNVEVAAFFLLASRDRA